MIPPILGIHHVTAISLGVQTNYNFYHDVLGLRLVKKTVNNDDPDTYHLFYGSEAGEPGTLLTFFPWPSLKPGTPGTGQVSATQLLIDPDAVSFWLARLRAYDVAHEEPKQRFDEQYIALVDVDGMPLELVARPGFHPTAFLADIPENCALRGFAGVTLSLHQYQPTERLLTEVFGYRLLAELNNRRRYGTDLVPNAAFVDIVSTPRADGGRVAGGSVHHVAFRVADDDAQRYYQHRLAQFGVEVTPVVDRDYFKAIYFREPGGVLFEIATDTPGFTVDKSLAELGHHLQLPARYESLRPHLEQTLPPLTV